VLTEGGTALTSFHSIGLLLGEATVLSNSRHGQFRGERIPVRAHLLEAGPPADSEDDDEVSDGDLQRGGNACRVGPKTNMFCAVHMCTPDDVSEGCHNHSRC
jgi:hypothetical protein